MLSIIFEFSQIYNDKRSVGVCAAVWKDATKSKWLPAQLMSLIMEVITEKKFFSAKDDSKKEAHLHKRNRSI